MMNDEWGVSEGLGPALPGRRGLGRFDLREFLFLLGVLLLAAWLTWHWRGPLQEAERLALLEARCVELGEEFSRLYWEVETGVCAWKLGGSG